jgi:hypothetical protein
LSANDGLRVCDAGSGRFATTEGASASGGAMLWLTLLTSAGKISRANMMGSTWSVSFNDAQFRAAIGNF